MLLILPTPHCSVIALQALPSAAASNGWRCCSTGSQSRLATFLTGLGAYSYKTAFDEAYARFSPGVLLQREALSLVEDPQISWIDSCAAPDHAMIDHIWRERRAIARHSIAIGGPWRRQAFRMLAQRETGAAPEGIA